MKKVLFFLAAFSIMLLPSCGKEARFKKNLSEEFAKIPKDTKGVVIFNLEDMTDKISSGGEDEMGNLLEDAMGSKMFDRIEILVKRETPIDFSKPAIMFEMNDNPVFTFSIRNEKEFRRVLSEDFEKDMRQRNGVWISDDDAIYQIGNQVWITIPNERITPNDLKKLSDMKENQSFMSRDVAKQLMDRNADISAIVDLNGFDNTSRDVAEMLMAMNAVFDDPAYFQFTVDFDEDMVRGQLTLLNKKGEPSPCVVNLEKIDMKAIESFTGKGDLFAASGVNSESISNAVKNLGGNIDYEEAALLTGFDGTSVVSVDLSNYDPYSYYGYSPRINATIGTKNASTASNYMNFVMNAWGTTNIDGMNLYADGSNIKISNPAAQGTSISNFSDIFEDAVFAAFVRTKNIPYVNTITNYIPSAYAVFRPEGKGYVLEFTVETTEGQNSLVTLLEMTSKIRKMVEN